MQCEEKCTRKIFCSFSSRSCVPRSPLVSLTSTQGAAEPVCVPSLIWSRTCDTTGLYLHAYFRRRLLFTNQTSYRIHLAVGPVGPGSGGEAEDRRPSSPNGLQTHQTALESERLRIPQLLSPSFELVSARCEEVVHRRPFCYLESLLALNLCNIAPGETVRRQRLDSRRSCSAADALNKRTLSCRLVARLQMI